MHGITGQYEADSSSGSGLLSGSIARSKGRILADASAGSIERELQMLDDFIDSLTTTGKT